MCTGLGVTVEPGAAVGLTVRVGCGEAVLIMNPTAGAAAAASCGHRDAVGLANPIEPVPRLRPSVFSSTTEGYADRACSADSTLPESSRFSRGLHLRRERNDLQRPWRHELRIRRRPSARPPANKMDSNATAHYRLLSTSSRCKADAHSLSAQAESNHDFTGECADVVPRCSKSRHLSDSSTSTIWRARARRLTSLNLYSPSMGTFSI